jgi:hypothetical protein
VLPIIRNSANNLRTKPTTATKVRKSNTIKENITKDSVSPKNDLLYFTTNNGIQKGLPFSFHGKNKTKRRGNTTTPTSTAEDPH